MASAAAAAAAAEVPVIDAREGREGILDTIESNDSGRNMYIDAVTKEPRKKSRKMGRNVKGDSAVEYCWMALRIATMAPPTIIAIQKPGLA
jgi:hypothetical protein